jgi:hypothetical protein
MSTSEGRRINLNHGLLCMCRGCLPITEQELQTDSQSFSGLKPESQIDSVISEFRTRGNNNPELPAQTGAPEARDENHFPAGARSITPNPDGSTATVTETDPANAPAGITQTHQSN